MRQLLLFFFAMFLTGVVWAQDDLFGTPKKEPKKGLVIGVNGGFDVPAFDMAKRFGLSYRVGPSLYYKTKKNWLIGARTDFLFGNQVKEPGLMSNLLDAEKTLIGANDFRIKPTIFERGYMIGLQAGKILNYSQTNSDKGLYLAATAGFIQHKILITDGDGAVPQLGGEYKKGYDRLANGVFLAPYAGYMHFSNNGLINFHLGVEALMGFTAGRRTYWYDVKQPGEASRFDMLFSVRGGWFIPVFKRKSEEFFFE
ncbi:MAG TPA: hypothetical protein VL098_12140 [Flavipsychrobacter sp.]|nr:hypothetical protein [Flavipsychrobacter sp.]